MGESRGSNSVSLLLSEKGFKRSDSDVDALGAVDLSGNSGGFIEHPVGVKGGSVVGVSGFN